MRVIRLGRSINPFYFSQGINNSGSNPFYNLLFFLSFERVILMLEGTVISLCQLEQGLLMEILGYVFFLCDDFLNFIFECNGLLLPFPRNKSRVNNNNK